MPPPKPVTTPGCAIRRTRSNPARRGRCTRQFASRAERPQRSDPRGPRYDRQTAARRHNDPESKRHRARNDGQTSRGMGDQSRPSRRQLLAEDGRYRRAFATSSSLRRMIEACSTERSPCCAASRSARSIGRLDEKQSPAAPVRWVNQWDNLDGTIERGYGGRSIFWENGHARADLTRVREYGRLLASLGINGCSINNVNADPRILTPEFIAADRAHRRRVPALGRAGGALGRFRQPEIDRRTRHVRSARSQRRRVVEVQGRRNLRAVPDLGGFVMKADSEGRVGPSAYGRTHADAANVVARALKPHGGLIFYRGFVYDHHMDWQQSEERPRPRRLRQLQAARRQVRRQRRHPDQERPHRFPGARAGIAALRRARENQSSDRTADHAGVYRPGAAHGFSGAHVERDARFRHACDTPTPVKRLVTADSWAWPTSGSTTTGSAIISRRPISTASAGWPGIPI